ncbi:MAG: ABC transporter ATP-binding protein [Bacilli bacterium]
MTNFSNKLLTIKDLSKDYYMPKSIISAVLNVSFDLYENQIISILGPSGSGKSTILSILCNLDKQTSGTIKYKENITIGIMLQTDELFEYLTVYENCLLPLKINKICTKENIEYIENLLDKYNLKEFKDENPKNLSGGMRQRVSLIRTLSLKPDILFLDEPFSSLDYTTRLKLSDDVYRILKEEKKSAVIVTHDIEEAISMSNKIIILTKRPSVVKNIYEINDLIENKPTKKRKEKNFSKYFNKIWEDLENGK